MCVTKSSRLFEESLRCNFGGAKPPKPPPPPPKPPTPNDAASSTQQFQDASRKGRDSTILAGETMGAPGTQRKTLLGG